MMSEESHETKADKELDAKYQAYLDHRKQLNQGELEVSGRYDQWLLTLSGGALGLSIAFLEKLTPDRETQAVYLLALSWTALVAAILCGLFSLYVSQKSYCKERDNLDADPLGVKEFPKNPWQGWTSGLNISSSILFGIGIIFLCVFALLNLGNL